MHFFLNLLNVGTKSTHISDGNSLEPATKKKRTSYESVSLPEGRYSVVLSYIYSVHFLLLVNNNFRDLNIKMLLVDNQCP